MVEGGGGRRRWKDQILPAGAAEQGEGGREPPTPAAVLFLLLVLNMQPEVRSGAPPALSTVHAGGADGPLSLPRPSKAQRAWTREAPAPRRGLLMALMGGSRTGQGLRALRDRTGARCAPQGGSRTLATPLAPVPLLEPQVAPGAPSWACRQCNLREVAGRGGAGHLGMGHVGLSGRAGKCWSVATATLWGTP